MQVIDHIRGRPCVGEELSGDAALVRRIGGVTWVMLVDALGHGPEEAKAAELAVDEAGSFPAELGVEAGLRRLHRRLQDSRGAGAILMRFEARGVELTGVGNLVLRTLAGPSLPYVPTSGIIGKRLPRVRSLRAQLDEPGRALLFSDGVDRRVALSSMSSLSPERLLDTLLANHSVERDDATLIHLEYVSPPQAV